MDDVLSLNNSRFVDFIYRIYSIELEIKDTTDTDRSASYLDLHLEIDSDGRLRTKLYDKRNFNFPIVNFSFIYIHFVYIYIYIYSNIPTAPAYGVYLSVYPICKSLCFTVADMTCLTVTEYLCHKWPQKCSTCHKHFQVFSSFMTYHWITVMIFLQYW